MVLTSRDKPHEVNKTMTQTKDPETESVDDTEEIIDDKEPTLTDPSDTKDTKEQQSTSSGEDWESRYKGQQRVMAKKDAQLQKLQEQLDTLNTRIEELLPTVDKSTKEKEALQATKTTLEEQLEEAKQDANAVKQQLAQTEIIMQEFPDLATVAKYIPPSEDDDTYRKNAKAFSEAVQGLLDENVKDVLSGSSPGQPAGNEGMATSAEEDALWSKLMACAGVLGKEQEYEELYAQWMTLQNSKKT